MKSGSGAGTIARVANHSYGIVAAHDPPVAKAVAGDEPP
jgi:hypothetical protein